ncbi:MAG: NAD(P)H-hydrate dehydratase, partial [Anaerotardibacter sp.]
HLAEFYTQGSFRGEALTGEGILKARAEQSIPLIITPHLGEAARLCKAAGVETQTQEEKASQLAKAYGATVVLKGPDTIIADESQWYVMTKGTAALAKAGTGDVLAGMIAALLAQELSAFDASCLGSTLHAVAGVCAASQLTEICVTPEDVVSHIPAAIAHVS